MQKNKRSISVSFDKAWQAEIARYDDTGVTAGGLIKHWLEEYFDLLLEVQYQDPLPITWEEIEKLAKIPPGPARQAAIYKKANHWTTPQLIVLQHVVESACTEGGGVVDRLSYQLYEVKQ